MSECRTAASGDDVMEAAKRGCIDDVITPNATRPRMARALAMLREGDGGDVGQDVR